MISARFARPLLPVLPVLLALLAVPLLAADADNEADEPVSALQRSIELQEEMQRIDTRIAELEAEFGPWDLRLDDTLDNLAGVMIDIGDFDGAHRILERRLQLYRRAEGPASPIQLPVIQALIDNDLRRRDWESVSDRIEFIYWITTQDPNADPESILQARSDVVNWKFAEVYLDVPTRRLRAFREARQLIRENTRDAEELFPGDSLELAPWLYDEAVLQYQLVNVLVANDELGLHARDEILLLEARSAESYLREGLNLVKRIRDIAEASGDLEAEAMAMTYEADFQILLDLGTAPALYRDAMDKMREAGLPETDIVAFYQRPIVLPEPRFHLRMADSIAYHESYGYQLVRRPDGQPESVHLGTFVAWSESLPFARRPPLPPQTGELDNLLELEELELEFTLNSRGYTRNPDILESTTDSAGTRRDTREAMKDMKFRPWFVDGRWTRVRDLTIRYRILPD